MEFKIFQTLSSWGWFTVYWAGLISFANQHCHLMNTSSMLEVPNQKQSEKQ